MPPGLNARMRFWLAILQTKASPGQLDPVLAAVVGTAARPERPSAPHSTGRPRATASPRPALASMPQPARRRPCRGTASAAAGTSHVPSIPPDRQAGRRCSPPPAPAARRAFPLTAPGLNQRLFRRLRPARPQPGRQDGLPVDYRGHGAPQDLRRDLAGQHGMSPGPHGTHPGRG